MNDGARLRLTRATTRRLAEVVVLLFDHSHPHPQHPLAQRRDGVHPPRLTGPRIARPGRDQTIRLELRQGAVDRRPVDMTEVKLLQAGNQPVAVPGMLRQEQQDRGKDEATRRGQFEPRSAFLGSDRRAVFHGQIASLPGPFEVSTAMNREYVPSMMQKTLIYRSGVLLYHCG
jgi:hypothetical protein